MTGENDYLVWIEPEEGVGDTLPEGLNDGWQASGISVQQAYRDGRRWWLQVRAEAAAMDRMEPPPGWRLGVKFAAVPLSSVSRSGPEERERRLGDPISFAVLQWPAVIGLFALPAVGWWWLLQATLVVWLLLSVFSAYLGRYRATPQFGSALLVSNLCIAAACWSHPSPWACLWVFAAVMLLYTAQRALLGLRGGAPSTAG